jgi:hypothetical protein
MTWKQGAHPRVSAHDAYPRQHNTLTKDGIDNEPRLARQDRFSDSCPTAARPEDHLGIALARLEHGDELVAQRRRAYRNTDARVTRADDELDA